MCRLQVQVEQGDHIARTHLPKAQHMRPPSFCQSALRARESNDEPAGNPNAHPATARPSCRRAERQEAPEPMVGVGQNPQVPAHAAVSCKHTTSCAPADAIICRHVARRRPASPPIAPKRDAEFHVHTASGTSPDHAHHSWSDKVLERNGFGLEPNRTLQTFGTYDWPWQFSKHAPHNMSILTRSSHTPPQHARWPRRGEAMSTLRPWADCAGGQVGLGGC